MGASEKFCLRWNDFGSNLSVAFRDIRAEEDLFDITLACEDTSELRAHKLILSACSPFFRNLLHRLPHQHPLLYLKGVKQRDLDAVLTFMYAGEVNVAQEELNAFLAVAEELQVKGLTQNSSGGTDSKQKPPAHPSSNSRPALTTQQARSLPPPRPTRVAAAVGPLHPEEDEVCEVGPLVKVEPGDTGKTGPGPLAVQEIYEEEASYEYEQYDGYETGGVDPNTGVPYSEEGNKVALSVVSSKMLETVDGAGRRLWQCAECDYARNKKDHVTKHVEQKHSGLQFVCEYCNAVFYRRDTFKEHLKKKHA